MQVTSQGGGQTEIRYPALETLPLRGLRYGPECAAQNASRSLIFSGAQLSSAARD
jgi:hypothetical protein